jgi:hypothetical protein
MDRGMITRLNRRDLLQGAASLSLFSFLGCGYSTHDGAQTPVTVPPPAPTGPLVASSLTVSATPVGTIPSRFLGLSYEKTTMSYGYFHNSNHHLIALFRLLGKGVVRIGGGSVDRLLWTSASQGTHLQVCAANIKALAGFLVATGWQCLYAVNLATSTPALAAAEAAYAVAALGTNLLGIEIGNEPDEYGVTGEFFAGNWTYQDYLSRWQMFQAAILAAAPGAPMTGPACGGANHISTWTLPFGQAEAGGVTLLTQHYYRLSGASSLATAAYLISPDPRLTAALTTLSAGARQIGIPYRLSECNSFSNGGAIGVSNSYASSLWVIDFLFAGALYGASGVNLHGGGNAPGYTPIADDSGAVIDARPEYYGLLFFALAGTGTLLETTLSVGRPDVTAYAVQSPSGSLNVMVVNKNAQQNLVLAIETSQTIHGATMQTMQAPSLAATSGVTIQGAMVNSDGSFNPAAANVLTVSGTQTICSVPALSAALISIT